MHFSYLYSRLRACQIFARPIGKQQDTRLKVNLSESLSRHTSFIKEEVNRLMTLHQCKLDFTVFEELHKMSHFTYNIASEAS